MNRQTTSPLADVADAKRRNRDPGKRCGSEEGPNRAIGLTGYSLASCTDAGREITPPEICDAIRNATTMAGTLISLRNWSTESIVVVPQGNFKSPSAEAAARRRSIRPLHGLLIACQKLVRVGRPGNREQRQNRYNGQRFHAVMVVFDCGQKRQSLAHFLDQPGKQSWRQVSCPVSMRDQGPFLRTVASPTHFSP